MQKINRIEATVSMMDLGVHVAFDRGLALQSNYAELVGADLPAKAQPNNFQLYFEVEDFGERSKAFSGTGT